MKTTKYNDGTSIEIVTDESTWKANYDNKLEKLMMCYYDNSSSNKRKYGGLYNWYVVDKGSNGNRNVCPSGWHVPSDREWEALLKFVSRDQGVGNKESDGGWTIIAKYLKSKSGWDKNGNGSDVYGFSGVPGNKRYNDGDFYGSIGSYGYWWSSTSYSTNDAWRRVLNYDDSNVSRLSYSKYDGFSVRCVRD